MSIKKFSHISYGSYRDFKWDNDLQEFSNLNIIYGRNYSGKTTLSRILRSLELRKKHEDYENAAFELCLENNQTLNQANIENAELCIRVYNKDFVRDNLKFLIDESGDIEAFSCVVLGQENQQTLDEIYKLKNQLGNNSEQDEQKSGLYKDLNDLKKELANIESNKKTKENKLTNDLSDKAREIKQDSNLKAVTYNKRNIEQDIDKINGEENLPQYILNDDDKDKCKNILKDEAKNPINFQVNFNKDSFAEILNKSNEVLAKQIIPKENIENKLRKWLNEGLELHDHTQQTQKCEFCENIITAERIKWLIDNVRDDSDEKRILENNLKSLLEQMEKSQLKIDDLLKIKSENFYSTHKDKFYELQNLIKEQVDNYNRELNKIKEKLEQKQDDIFSVFKIENTKDFSQELQNTLDSINALCDQNDEKTKNLKNEQKEAREKLRLSEVANFVREKQYYERLQEIENLGQNLEDKQKEISSKEQEIKSIEAQIKEKEDSLNNEVEGTRQVNEYLKGFLGNVNLRFDLENSEIKQGKFRVLRGDEVAKNLSEGECSLLAFCYFVAKLKDKNTSDKKLIIWIDDPISSLDNNHIFFIFSLISSEIIKNKEKFEQIFISTHSLEFLKYLKWDKRTDNKTRHFLIENIDKSCIKKMPEILREYATEFNYLFKQIYDFRNIDEQQDENINGKLTYNLGNNLRRFLDIYLFFKYPTKEELREKVKNFFKDKATLVNKYINEYSHSQDIDRAMKPLDNAEAKNIVECVLETIKKKDSEQYKALEESIGIKQT